VGNLLAPHGVAFEITGTGEVRCRVVPMDRFGIGRQDFVRDNRYRMIRRLVSPCRKRKRRHDRLRTIAKSLLVARKGVMARKGVRSLFASK
jgi:hypothetical protein